MAKVMGKIEKGVVPVVRDITGLGVTGILSQGAGIVGAVISIFVSPRIAATRDGKVWNRGFAYLMVADKAIELVLGPPGAI